MATSRRGYVTIAEVEERADVTSTNDAEFLDQISQAEELIDAYVGFQTRAIPNPIHLEVSAVNSKTIYDTAGNTRLNQKDNYFAGCTIEVVGGTGSGQVRTIESSDEDGLSVTVDTAFSPQLDTTSVCKVYQLGKFPRTKDIYTNRDNTRYYKSIPDAIKRATAAQVQFIIEMGPDYFSSDASSVGSEQIGNYSYSRGNSGDGQSSSVKLIAPKARTLLRGFKNSTGRLIPENPTCL